MKPVHLEKKPEDFFPNNNAWRVIKWLHRVHADLCGTKKIESLGGSKYFILLTVDYSHMSWVYFIKHKLDAFDCFYKFITMAELQIGHKIKALQIEFILPSKMG